MSPNKRRDRLEALPLSPGPSRSWLFGARRRAAGFDAVSRAFSEAEGGPPPDSLDPEARAHWSEFAALRELAQTPLAPETAADLLRAERALLRAVRTGPARAPVRRYRLVVGGGLAVAAGLALALVIGDRPVRHANLTEASTDAVYEHVLRADGTKVLAEEVRLRRGRIELAVRKLGPGQRFRVLTDDAEVRVVGTRFSVEVEEGRLAEVAVTEGVVEVRWAGEAPVRLEAGERFSPPAPSPDAASSRPGGAPPEVPRERSDSAEAMSPPPSGSSILARSPRGEPRRSSAPPRRPAAKRAEESVVDDRPIPPAEGASPAEPVEPPTLEPGALGEPGPSASKSGAPERPAPAERSVASEQEGAIQFAAAMGWLDAGRSRRAAEAFAAVEGELAEEARYWQAVALERAGELAAAAEALHAVPAGPRRAEADLRLAAIEHRLGRVEEARRRFESLERHPDPNISSLAGRWLDRIGRR